MQGLCAIHVDDFIHAGTDVFESTVLNNFQSSFKIGKTFSNSFTYVGLEINHNSDTIEFSQKTFMNALSFIPLTQQRKNQKYYGLNQEEETLLPV